jgi:hypothetical protein
MSEEKVTLEFLAEQQRRLLDEMAAMRLEAAGHRTEFVNIRDSITVLTAIAMRQDNTLKALLDEVRAMHTQFARFNDRLREVEQR